MAAHAPVPAGRPPAGPRRPRPKRPLAARPIDLRDPDLYHALMAECSREESTPDYAPPPLVSRYLVQNDVRPLKKRSPKFPHAQYYCRLCDYHCDTLTICISHIKDTRHSCLAHRQELETTLFHLPKPTRPHLEQLEPVLRAIELEHGLTRADRQLRAALAERISQLVAQMVPQATVRLYGSSLSGFGLQNSALNLDLVLPEAVQPALGLTRVVAAMGQAPEVFRGLTKDFSCKMPSIHFTLEGLKCELSCSNTMAVQTSLLLRDYMELDPRVASLATVVRYWAQLCRIDRQADGTLPPHALALLLVFFLQQETQPVLPCIHDFLANREVVVYERPSQALAAFQTRNTKTVAELLIEFFEFYALGFRMPDFVASIRFVGGISKDTKQWKGKKLSIEDPFSIKRNLTRSVNSLQLLDYINDGFKLAYLYFGTVQTSNGPVILKILVPDRTPERKTSPNNDNEAIQGNGSESVAGHQIQDMLIKLSEDNQTPLNVASAAVPRLPSSAITLEHVEAQLKAVTLHPGTADGKEPHAGIVAQELGETEEEEDDEEDMRDDTLESFLTRHGQELTPKQAKRVTELVPKNMIEFRFDVHLLPGGQFPVHICTVCGNEGHLQSNCPDEMLPPPKNLPPISPDFGHVMEALCVEVMHRFAPMDDELRDRDNIVQTQTRFIQKLYPKACLKVFGSSFNGFAFSKSDLDMSLTFTDHKTDEDLDVIEIINNLAQEMQKVRGIVQIQAITSAKVPILKFVHSRTRLMGDISLYNVLAQENTQMLQCYSSIDKRVKNLGYMVKLFARTCGIGDASRGSLSSYAYILMMIHYLQQVNPPVIPVLQELEGGNEAHTNMVSGWNAWFFKDMDRIGQVWPDIGRNQSSVFQLWLGFLKYFGHDFDSSNFVVTIKQNAPLTKFEKMWNSGCIAIEDPFDTSHNLGVGISRKMNLFIRKAFIKTRERFGICPPSIPSGYRTPVDYFFDAEYMTEGQIPNDRGCRMCGCIGHMVKECPRRLQAEERKRRMRQQQQQRQNKTSERQPQHQPQHQPQLDQGDRRSKMPPQPPQPLPAKSPRASNPPAGSNILDVLGLAESIPPSSEANQPPPLPSSGAISLEQLERSLQEPKFVPRPIAPPGFEFRPPPPRNPNTFEAFVRGFERNPQGQSPPVMPPGMMGLPPGMMGLPPGMMGLPPRPFMGMPYLGGPLPPPGARVMLPMPFMGDPRGPLHEPGDPRDNFHRPRAPPMHPFMSMLPPRPPGNLNGQNMFTQIQIPSAPQGVGMHRRSPDFLGGLRQGSLEVDHSPPSQPHLGPIMRPGALPEENSAHLPFAQPGAPGRPW